METPQCRRKDIGISSKTRFPRAFVNRTPRLGGRVRRVVVHLRLLKEPAPSGLRFLDVVRTSSGAYIRPLQRDGERLHANFHDTQTRMTFPVERLSHG